MPHRLVLIALALVVAAVIIACGHRIYRGDRSPPEGPSAADGGWVVSSADALLEIEAGARVLDVRSADAFAAGHIPGAVRVEWQAFSALGEADKGDLHPDDAVLADALAPLGLSAEVPVRVVADPVNGWGEDGRIVWMLRTLGHPDAALVDGGVAALVEAGATLSTEAATPPPGDFVIARDPSYAIDTTTLRGLIADGASTAGEVVLVDAREAREYAGETPYGETRGGHLPGAVHLHYKSLLTPTGYLLPRDALEALLTEEGITADTPVVVYCTGGVRSGWFVAVLRAMGFADVRNYAGSMWQWSAGPAEAFPLEVD